MTESLEPTPLVGRPALRRRQRLGLLEVQCGVSRPVLEQGQVAKKDVDLGMIRGLSNSRLQGGTNRRDLIAHECQLGEQGVGRRQLRVRLDGLGELLEAGVEISLLEAL